MNSFYRYLTRITRFLGLWIVIFPGLGMGYDAATANLPLKINSSQSADGGGKIMMQKLATESSPKQLQASAQIHDQQPPPAKMHPQLGRSKHAHQSAAAKPRKMHAQSSKPKRQPVVQAQSSETATPVNAPPPPETEHIDETPAMQAPVTAEPPVAVDQTPLSTKSLSQPYHDENLPSTGKKDDDIQVSSIKPSKSVPEYAPQLESIPETVGIIARLLFKFSLITVCCIALYFSFSALQIAKSNQRMRYRAGGETAVG